jgi:hypothetical protein
LVLEIDRLVAIEAIRTLKARYFRCVDTKDWRGFASLFTADVRFDISTDAGPCILESPDAIAHMARTRLENCVSVHHGHCPEIRVISDTCAEAIWAMEDMLRWNDPASSSIRTLHGFGHYTESYRKEGGEWRIRALRLTRLRVDVTSWDDSIETN